MPGLSSQPSHTQPNGRASAAQSEGLGSFLPQAFLADLSLAELDYERRLAQLPQAARPRVLALLLAAQPEIVRLASIATVAGSIANALAAGTEPGGPRFQKLRTRSLLRFFPNPSSNYMLAASRLRRMAPQSRTTDRLDSFDATLSQATQAVVGLAAGGFAVTPPLDTVKVLAVRWREACSAAIDLLRALNNDLAEFRLESRSSAVQPLLQGLGEVADGRWPMLDPEGKPGMPQWADTRRQPRVSVACPALLHHDRGYADVLVTDVSPLGVGLRCGVPLTVSSRVMLFFDAAIVMIGRVAWSRGESAGIEFDQPFFDQSPELRFLMQRRAPFDET